MTPSPRPTEAPASEAEELPPLPVSTASKIVVPSPAPVAPTEIVRSIGSSLSAETLREIEEVARLQDEAMKRNPPPTALGAGTAGDINAGSTSENGGGSRLVLPRPPSPTEARPIRVIPVPEDFVPLPPRQWDPQRKYWAAAATCHMPLYFQDAVLERYGQSVEQAIGPKGRFFSYPLDDPKQSNQRNQLLQPMYSAGLFLGQIALLPYNMLMDPPWEAEYDLGYYRPGDKIPGDTYYLPKTGIGPFLRGNRY